jgi:hypothetical protein
LNEGELLVGSVHHPHINRIHERPVWCRDRGHWSDPWRIRIRDGNRIEAVSNPMPRLIVTREAHGAFWIATREDDPSRSYGGARCDVRLLCRMPSIWLHRCGLRRHRAFRKSCRL